MSSIEETVPRIFDLSFTVKRTFVHYDVQQERKEGEKLNIMALIQWIPIPNQGKLKNKAVLF
jgi:hypothetical protein